MTALPLVKTTYLPEPEQVFEANLLDMMAALKDRSPNAPEDLPHLVDGTGKRYDLPENIIEPMLLVARSLMAGKAVSVVPVDQVLTTQQAADFLGISRPTLVKLLEKGDIPFEKISRHRRVKLSDLLAYQESRKKRVRETLAELSRESMADGSFEKTIGLPPAMR